MEQRKDLKFKASQFKDYDVLILANKKEYYFPRERRDEYEALIRDKELVHLPELLEGIPRGPQGNAVDFVPTAPKTISRRFVLMLEEVAYHYCVPMNLPPDLQPLYEGRVKGFFEKMNKAPTRDELIGIAINLMTEVRDNMLKQDEPEKKEEEKPQPEEEKKNPLESEASKAQNEEGK